jgi:hypothetical protein
MDEHAISASAARKRLSLPPVRTIGPLIWLSEVQPVLAQAYIVRDLIAAGSAVLHYGDSNSGKTFFMLDLCLHIAAGRPWRDHRVQPGLVVYVAAEGGHGIRNRLAAYRQAAPWTKGASFAVLPQNVDLLDPLADTGPLIEVIRAAEETAGQKTAAIVLDTLARVMVGGNENDSRDMSGFIANVDRIRAETGAAVLIVHHAGKDATKGARGHSSLRAAVDTEILVEGLDGTRTATVCKQRDMPSGQVYAFTLEPVTVGTDAEDGTPITSCVVAVTDAPATKKRGPTGKQQGAILRLIEAEAKAGRPILTTGEIIKLSRDRLDIPKSSARSAVVSLTSGQFLIPTIGGLTLSEGISA